jgi:hypothetical protein
VTPTYAHGAGSVGILPVLYLVRLLDHPHGQFLQSFDG